MNVSHSMPWRIKRPHRRLAPARHGRRGAQHALAHKKRALQRGWSVDLDDAFEHEANRQGIAGATVDHPEGLAAFLEKRPPRFTGD